jgi:hypothetical protein
MMRAAKVVMMREGMEMSAEFGDFFPALESRMNVYAARQADGFIK